MTRGSSCLETSSSWLDFVSGARRARGFDSAVHENHDKSVEEERELRISLDLEKECPLSGIS